MQVQLLTITAKSNLFMGSVASVVFVYVAISYIISGFLCYVYFLKYLFSHSKNLNIKLYMTALTSYWIIAFWPVWIIRGTLSADRECNKQ